MSPHTVTVTDETVTENTIRFAGRVARCTCGWVASWPGRGSEAEKDARAHERKHRK